MHLIKIFSKLKTGINIHSLKFKLILSIIALFLFFILIVVINNIVTINIIMQRTNQSIINTVKQTNNYLSFLFEKASGLTLVLSNSNSLVNYVNNKSNESNSPYEDYKNFTELQNSIMSNAESNNEFESIYVYINNRKQLITSNLGVFTFSGDTRGISWLDIESELSKKQQISSEWVSHFTAKGLTSTQRNLLCIMSRANRLSNSYLKSEVYISVNLSEESIYAIIKNIKITPNTIVYMLDNQNRITAADNVQILGMPIGNIMNIDINQLEENGVHRVKIDSKGYYQAIYNKNSVNGWGVLVFIPENELLATQRNLWYAILSIVLAVTIILIFIAGKIISSYVDRPVAKLVEFMRLAEKGEFDREIDEERLDEFGFLYKSYNYMVKRIKKLIKELYEEKLIQKKSELKLLQSQINPHFLYNTLETINCIAVTHKVTQISKMVIAMSDIYKTTFNRGRDFIEIKGMILTIKSYLYIQKLRFGNKFDYAFDIDESIDELLVINLLLQPIVENAVVYGIGEKNGKGLINISVKLMDNLVQICVRDDGKGMNAEKLNLLQKSLNYTGNYDDSGLRNINKRIQLIYGVKYGIEVSSKPNEGTCIKLSLPYFNYISEKAGLE